MRRRPGPALFFRDSRLSFPRHASMITRQFFQPYT